MAGWILMTFFIHVDVAAGVEFLRTFGSARRAEWFSGEVMRKCCAGMCLETRFCRSLRCSKREC